MFLSYIGVLICKWLSPRDLVYDKYTAEEWFVTFKCLLRETISFGCNSLTDETECALTSERGKFAADPEALLWQGRLVASVVWLATTWQPDISRTEERSSVLKCLGWTWIAVFSSQDSWHPYISSLFFLKRFDSWLYNDLREQWKHEWECQFVKFSQTFRCFIQDCITDFKTMFLILNLKCRYLCHHSEINYCLSFDLQEFRAVAMNW